jgi:S-adenosylmethionine synthetase
VPRFRNSRLAARKGAGLLAAVWLAGGGIAHAQVVTTTDPLAPKLESDPRNAPQFQKSNRAPYAQAPGTSVFAPAPSGAGRTGYDSTNARRSTAAPKPKAGAKSQAIAPGLPQPVAVSPYQRPAAPSGQGAYAQAPPTTTIGPIRRPLPKRKAGVPEDPYAPLGLRAGSFDWFPAVELVGGYSNNPSRSPNKRGASLLTVAPELRAQSNWSRHELKSELRGSYTGYSPDETPTLMPLPIFLAHRLASRLSEVRKNGTIPYLRPDGKTQVTIEYDGDKAVRLDTVVVSSQHASDIDLESLLAPDIREFVVEPELKALLDEGIKLETEGYRLLVNPTGRFEIGGPMGDAGLTGRKIIVDTYGGMARHGGGAFSGKDPSKVDRSAAYAARWVAKHVVASGAATKCEVQVAYAIGVAEPVSVLVETFGTGTVAEEKIAKAVRAVFGLMPREIMEGLNLRRPIYEKTAAYGHFGRKEKSFTWEQVDRAEQLAQAAGFKKPAK